MYPDAPTTRNRTSWAQSPELALEGRGIRKIGTRGELVSRVATDGDATKVGVMAYGQR